MALPNSIEFLAKFTEAGNGQMCVYSKSDIIWSVVLLELLEGADCKKLWFAKISTWFGRAEWGQMACWADAAVSWIALSWFASVEAYMEQNS